MIGFDDKSWDSKMGNLVFNLTGVSRNVDNLCKSLVTELTELVKKESIRRCPVDKGNLEADHKSEVRYGFGGYYGRIYIPFGSISTPYAPIMHEGYYELGTKSKEKQSRSTVMIGRKFLERAFEENRAAISSKIVDRLSEVLK